MANPTPSGDAPWQAAVYRLYLYLQSVAARRFSGSLAGRLVLSIGFDISAAELALATTIAGGAFLGLEPDPQRLKIAVRNGSCDFMVNTLDEALRVLKNELRQHKPLSTGLLGNAEENLSAMLGRGVQPDLLCGQHAGMDILAKRGAEFLIPPNAELPLSNEITWIATNPQDLRQIDRTAWEILPQDDHIRRRWLEQAPGSFHRQTPPQRVLSLNPEEVHQFQNALRDTPLQAPATLRWRTLGGIEQSIEL